MKRTDPPTQYGEGTTTPPALSNHLNKAAKVTSVVEKYFWFTLLALLLVYVMAQAAALFRSPAPLTTHNPVPPLTDRVVDIFLPTDTVNQNLLIHRNTLDTAFNEQRQILENVIEKRLDTLFQESLNNVDRFLDFHYSVKGEYMELGAMALGQGDKIIYQKLLADDFQENYLSFQTAVETSFLQGLHSFISTLDQVALKGVDPQVNKRALERLQTNITRNMHIQEGKLGIAGAGIGAKLLQAIGVKVAAKTSSKGVAKGGSKLAAKTAAAGSGGALGTLCGPAAPLCGALFAATLWFGTDAVVVNGDEYLHRKSFREEIIHLITNTKKEMEREYKQLYTSALKRKVEELQEQYKGVQIQKRVKRRIRDRL